MTNLIICAVKFRLNILINDTTEIPAPAKLQHPTNKKNRVFPLFSVLGYFFVFCYNNSPPSDTLKLLKPDTLAPIAAVIQSIVVDSAQLLMRWIASPSQDRARYAICRSCPQRDTLLVSQDFELRQLHFSSEPGVACSYTMTVVDSSGNSSTSLPYAYTYEPGFRNAITNLQAHVDRVNKQITLTWQAPQSTVYHYEIYRATAGNKPKLYATLGDAQATSFIDRDLKANNQYVYVVKYVSSTGVHSLVVEIVVVY